MNPHIEYLVDLVNTPTNRLYIFCLCDLILCMYLVAALTPGIEEPFVLGGVRISPAAQWIHAGFCCLCIVSIVVAAIGNLYLLDLHVTLYFYGLMVGVFLYLICMIAFVVLGQACRTETHFGAKVYCEFAGGLAAVGALVLLLFKLLGAMLASRARRVLRSRYHEDLLPYLKETLSHSLAMEPQKQPKAPTPTLATPLKSAQNVNYTQLPAAATRPASLVAVPAAAPAPAPAAQPVMATVLASPAQTASLPAPRPVPSTLLRSEPSIVTLPPGPAVVVVEEDDGQALCPALVLSQGESEVYFTVPAASLQGLSLGNYPVDLLGPSGRTLLYARLPAAPSVGTASAAVGLWLELSTTATSECPQGAVGPLFPGVRSREPLEVRTSIGRRFALLEPSGTGWRVVRRGRTLMLLEEPGGGEVRALSPDGEAVAVAMNEADMALRLQMAPGVDALLTLICLLAVALMSPERAN